ncbi:MAG: 2TM domain-containing protein [Defluviicoccus sp.]|nr:2TM domain-containing protein [Defluviicoccus sp.]
MTTGTGNAQSDFPDDERRAMEDVRNIRSFYIHVLLYGVVVAGLAVVNLLANPDYLWFLWAALGWGIGLAAHGLSAFKIVDLFGHEWEKRQVAKRLANSRHNRNAKS